MGAGWLEEQMSATQTARSCSGRSWVSRWNLSWGPSGWKRPAPGGLTSGPRRAVLLCGLCVSPGATSPSLLSCSPTSSGRKNSRTMLLPLLQRFPEQVRVSLFHTPNLRGLLRLLIPERFNETIGLQHIKVYLFDNNVILSG